MKIVYIGNFTFPWCTETHIALTLEKLGHRVISLQENTTTLADVLTACEDADYLFWTRTYGMMQFDGFEMLRRLTIPSVSFHLDYYFGISREAAMPKDPFWFTDYVFQPDGDHLEDFRKLGINAYWSPPGVYAGEVSLEEQGKSHEIIFVGSWREYHSEWPWRREMVTKLLGSYPQAETFPQGEAIRGQQLNDLYQSTKIVVGDSLNPIGNTTYTSDRIFETTGRGGFILYPRIEWLTTVFPQEIFYESGNWPELSGKIQYYLSHDGEREELRKICHVVTKANHTYDQRLKAIFDVLRGKKDTCFDY